METTTPDLSGARERYDHIYNLAKEVDKRLAPEYYHYHPMKAGRKIPNIEDRIHVDHNGVGHLVLLVGGGTGTYYEEAFHIVADVVAWFDLAFVETRMRDSGLVAGSWTNVRQLEFDTTEVVN